ncbi:Ig-like domain-containing protein, partial [Vibrio vulnificus]|uniref:Ig-like domain-containing protein n=1 Tax=Vibrio vulnificus TaxID=672 RepID=UPI000D401107
TDAPELSISTNDANLIAGESATITFTFSEAVDGFDASDIETTGGTLSGLTTTDNITWTATFTPDANYDGQASISVADDKYTDVDGNNGTGASLNLGVDTDAPELSISTNDANLIAGESATITFTFSEAVD